MRKSVCRARGMTQVDQRVFAELLLETQPALGLHLAALGPDNIICGIMASQWLLTLFVHALDDEATACLWDVLFKERHRRVLFAGCLVLTHATRTCAQRSNTPPDQIKANELRRRTLHRARPAAPTHGKCLWSGRSGVSRTHMRAGE